MSGKIVLLCLLGVLLPGVPAARAASPLLERIAVEEALGSTRLNIALSQSVPYRVQTSGQRINLFLDRAEVSSSLLLPSEDDKIVRTLVARGPEELMLSFLLRRVPARVNASADKISGRVTLEIFWDEGSTRPAIAFRISGLPAARVGDGVAGPRALSVYAGRWEDFFRDYAVPLQLSVPLFFSLPPRPTGVDEGEGEIGRLAEKLSAAGEWEELKQSLQLLEPSTDPRVRQGRTVLMAEALVHTGEMAAAQRLLLPLVNSELPGPVAERAVYLYALAAASDGDPFTARYQLSTLVHPAGPYVPHLRLLQGEIALAVGKPLEALAALQGDSVAWPPPLRPLRQLRLADALAASGKTGAAKKIYDDLIARPELLMQNVFSLRHCAETLLAAGDHLQAAFLFEELSRKMPPGPEQGLVTMAAALACLKGEDGKRALTLMSQLLLQQPTSEAGYRARLKLVDQNVLSGGELRRRTAQADYAEIARNAPSRGLREEAAFKQALLLFLSGEKEKSVRLLIPFCRSFARGPLRGEAGSLIREAMPSVIDALIERGEDMEALVMVEQCRDDLLAGGMDLDFLTDVAQAATRLGLLQRASRVYLYLLDAPGEPQKKEPFYLPMIELALARGESSLAGEFGRRYLERYPQGKDRGAIFLLRARALQEQGKLAEAAEVLRNARPRSNDVEMMAADLYWLLEDYAALEGCFSAPGLEAPPRGLFMKAEAFCRTGREEKALPIFRMLVGDPVLGDQAAFRLAELELTLGKRETGLEILKRLAEEGKDPLWRRLAGETLATEKL